MQDKQRLPQQRARLNRVDAMGLLRKASPLRVQGASAATAQFLVRQLRGRRPFAYQAQITAAETELQIYRPVAAREEL